MKKPLIFLITLFLFQFAIAGGVSSTNGDMIFYLFLVGALIFIGGMITIGKIFFKEIQTIAWIPIPYFLYMFSFWRRYC